MTDPCRCIEANPDCMRGGLPMVGRLYELCAGINCSPQLSEHYRRLWDSVRRPRCRYLGEPTGAAIGCPTCAGSTWIKTFACDVHATCSLATEVDGIACCAHCPDYTASNP
jgi:hypothetical protein